MGIRTASMRQASKQLPEGGIGNVIETVFFVDDDGPFIIDTRAEDFNAEAVRDKVHEFAAKVREARQAVAEAPEQSGG